MGSVVEIESQETYPANGQGAGKEGGSRTMEEPQEGEILKAPTGLKLASSWSYIV